MNAIPFKTMDEGAEPCEQQVAHAEYMTRRIAEWLADPELTPKDFHPEDHYGTTCRKAAPVRDITPAEEEANGRAWLIVLLILAVAIAGAAVAMGHA